MNLAEEQTRYDPYSDPDDDGVITILNVAKVTIHYG